MTNFYVYIQLLINRLVIGKYEGVVLWNFSL